MAETNKSRIESSGEVIVKSSAAKLAKRQLPERSLGIFSKDNPIRILCIRIMDHKLFSYIVLSLILGNCIFLALSEPFATCCSNDELAPDSGIIQVDPKNYSVKCDQNNDLLDGPTLVPLNMKCCIPQSMVENDPYNFCASLTLKATQTSAEIIFNILFTIEMGIKIISLGFITTKGTYLRDYWNMLDFVVVVVSWVSMLPGVANLSALRTFRVLRPLRTLSSIPGMRPVVSAMISCVKSMIHVLMLCAFLFTVFGIVGLQLFSGTLKGRCHYIDPSKSGNYEHAVHDFSEFSFMSILETDEAPCPLPCNTQVDSNGNWLFSAWTRSKDDCLEMAGNPCYERGNSILVNPWYDPTVTEDDPNRIEKHTVTLPEELLNPLPENSEWYSVGEAGNFTQNYDKTLRYVEVTSFCLDTGTNQLGDGFANFDSIGRAWLTIFTSITLEGWVDTMYGLQASFGHPLVVFVYFFFMVVLCSFFMLELTLAVINDAYDRAAEEEEERLRIALEHALQEEIELHHAQHEAHEKQVGHEVEEEIETLEHAKEMHEKEEKAKRELRPWGPPIIHKLFHFVNSKPFSLVVTLLIVLNTITLAMEKYNMSEQRILFLETTNLFFTAAFTIELVLKLIGLGPHQYFREAFNVFDFIIVTISLVELKIANDGGDSGGSGLGALRTFRLMRVFKLARSWKNLRKLLSTILLSVIDVTNAAILLAIIMFIFTLLGMQLFGGTWTGNYFCDDPLNYDECKGETPRANFDGFFWGFVTVFQILTGENWNEVMYIGKAVNGEIATVYFCALNLIGNYMVLNLFLAILLARFENDDADDEDDEDELESESKRIADIQTAAVAPVPTGNAVNANDTKPEHRFKRYGTGMMNSEEELTEEVPRKDPNKMTMNPDAYAFFVLSPEMPIRVKIFNLVNSTKFDNFILFLIGISTVLLAVEEPYVEECKETTCAQFANFLYIMDLILNVLFTGEMLLKMIALGVVLHKHSYLRGGWNILDFIIVGISITSLALGNDSTFKALKSLRSLRALRPLRVISRSPGMRLVVSAILAAGPAIANVTVVVILFMLIFAIMAVQQWSGGLNSCNDPNVPGPTMFDCVGYNSTFPPGDDYVVPTWTPVAEFCGYLPTDTMIEACLKNGTAGCIDCMERIWAPNGGFSNSYNFDNVGQALLVVFEVVSGEMWPDIMYSTMDIVGSDEPMREWPHREGTTVAWWYIMVTMVCSFMLINVFVGVIIDNFNQMKDEQNGSGLLTDEQKLWIETMKKTMEQKPIKQLDVPADPNRRFVWDIIMGQKFEFFIMGMILLNTFVMMLQSDGISSEMKAFTTIMNYLFLCIFTVEAILKLFAMRKQYFQFGWNCFDFSLVVFGYLGIIGGLGPIVSLFRIFRVARIFRLVRTSQGLLTIFRTLMYSIPSMLNVLWIFCLLMLIYSILAMNLFSGIKKGELLNDDANFDSFFNSMETLFRISTGESFNGIMHDCMIQPPYCSPEAGNCGYPQIAPIFFCSYFLLSAYTLLSMITAIILDNFNGNQAMAESAVSEEHIEAFKVAWSMLDPNGTMFIKEETLVRLVSRVPYPLGVLNTPDKVANGQSKRKLANALIRRIDVPTIRGTVSFNDVLTELTANAMPSIDLPESNQLVVSINDQKQLKQTEILNKLGASKECILYSAGQVNGAMLIQSAMRGFIYRCKLEEMIANGEEEEKPSTQTESKEKETPTTTSASALDSSLGDEELKEQEEVAVLAPEKEEEQVEELVEELPKTEDPENRENQEQKDDEKKEDSPDKVASTESEKVQDETSPAAQKVSTAEEEDEKKNKDDI